jgi:hypothetical protein
MADNEPTEAGRSAPPWYMVERMIEAERREREAYQKVTVGLIDAERREGLCSQRGPNRFANRNQQPGQRPSAGGPTVRP